MKNDIKNLPIQENDNGKYFHATMQYQSKTLLQTTTTTTMNITTTLNLQKSSELQKQLPQLYQTHDYHQVLDGQKRKLF